MLAISFGKADTIDIQSKDWFDVDCTQVSTIIDAPHSSPEPPAVFLFTSQCSNHSPFLVAVPPIASGIAFVVDSDIELVHGLDGAV